MKKDIGSPKQVFEVKNTKAKHGFQGNESPVLVFLIGDFCHMPVFLIDCQRIGKKSTF